MSELRRFEFGEVRLVCLLCRGRGWATRDAIARAEAEGTWPLREAKSAAPNTAEEELVRELDAHDELVAKCARGELTFAAFQKTYDNFYVRYPLDGHESDAEELRVFDMYASRIALHREIWEEVLTKVTDDEHLTQATAVDAGFIGSGEAVRRIQEVAQRHLKL
jgi:hypothetical protein